MDKFPMSSHLVMGISQSMPEVTNVYDSAKGRYFDTVCGSQNAPAYMTLPGTPSPIANVRKP